MTVLSIKRVVTRKEHMCYGCAREMPTYSEMEVVAWADLGKVSNTYWCKACLSYWSEHMDDEEIGYGDLRLEDPTGWEAIRQRVEDKDVGSNRKAGN